VRTGPYTAVREVALTRFDQGWETERFEVGVGKPNREGFGPSEVPGAASATGRVASQSRTNAQCQQCRSTTAGCFPLPPQSCTHSQPDPTSQVNQHIGRFTEPEAPPPVATTGGVAGGVPGGIPGGQLDGVIGGIISSSSSLAAVPRLSQPAPAVQRVRVSQGVTKGLLIYRVEPTYPPLAKHARIQGVIVMTALIDKGGKV
jgi:hypothetical protein